MFLRLLWGLQLSELTSGPRTGRLPASSLHFEKNIAVYRFTVPCLGPRCLQGPCHLPVLRCLFHLGGTCRLSKEESAVVAAVWYQGPF